MNEEPGLWQVIRNLQRVIENNGSTSAAQSSELEAELRRLTGLLVEAVDAAQALANAEVRQTLPVGGQLGEALQGIQSRLQQLEAWNQGMQEEQKRANQLALLNRFSLELSASLSLDALLHTLYEQLKQITTVDVFYIALYDPAADLVFFPVYADGAKYESYTFSDMRRRSIQRRPGFTGHILQTGDTLFIPDTLDPNAKMPFPPVRFGGRQARCYLGVPMRLRGDVTGVLSIQSYEAGTYTPEIIRLVETIAGQIVFAVENARLFEAARLRAQEAETLRQASAAIGETLDTAKAIERILDQLQRVVPYDTASVQLLRGDSMEIVGGRGFLDMQRILGMKFPINADSPSGHVIAAGQSMYTNDAQADFSQFREPPHDHIQSWMGVQLIFQDQLIGMLTLDGYQRDLFTPEHLHGVTVFADQVATVLQNSMLFEETQRLAITDPLTGLSNRRRFVATAEAEVERALRYRRPLSVIMIDIDYFKTINDTYGHDAGDEVLKFLAHSLKEKLPRKSDLPGRLGGEEFAILLPETDLEGAMHLAERIRNTIASALIPTHQGLLSITICLGAAFFEAGVMSTWEELYRRADQALYQAKRQGRNQIAAYTP